MMNTERVTLPHGIELDCLVAGDKGDTLAQYNLGQIYAEGRGIPQNYAEAAKWYRYAANKKPLYLQWNITDGSSKPATEDTEFGPAPTVTTIAASTTK